MKILFSKIAGATLILGIVAGGAFFAFRKPGRNSGRAISHSQRPESQTEDASAKPPLFRTEHQPEESEQGGSGSKLIATDSAKEPAIVIESATDWSRFRGPNGTGVSMDSTIPTEWSDTKNLRWKTKLPGPGSSSLL